MSRAGVAGFDRPAQADRPAHSWLFLAIALSLLAVANGRWVLPFAGWLAPAFLLLFLQSRSARSGLGAAFLVLFLAFSWNWRGMIPVPGLWYFVVTGTYAAVYFVPLVLHRWLSPRLPPLRSTLVLPTAWVAIELVFHKVVPYGTWTSLAYTQVDRIPLLQLGSWTGVAGIHFLMLWFAAVGAFIWRNRAEGRRAPQVAGAFAAVLFAVWIAGEMRVQSAPRAVEAIRVAGITPSARLTADLLRSMAEVRPSDGSEGGVGEAMHALADRINADLLERTRAEARAGSEVIVWSEHAATVTPETEPLLTGEAQLIAREFGVAIVMGVGVWRPKGQPAFENKAVVVSEGGDRVADFFKAKPIVGSESSLIDSGDSRVLTFEAAGVRWAVVICHDLDFPDFVRQAGREEALALLAPAADWDAITPLHARMAIPRAVENGCSLVRPCEGGLSLAVDPLGRVLATQADYGLEGNVMVCQVPRFRLDAAYPRLGDLFAWVCAVGLVGLAVSGRRNRMVSP